MVLGYYMLFELGLSSIEWIWITIVDGVHLGFSYAMELGEFSSLGQIFNKDFTWKVF